MPELLHDWIRLHAEARPEATAVVLGSRRLTYSELERQSNQVARVLKEHGCRKGDRVCILAPKSPEALVALAAVLKAGAIYVPLDPAGPAPRIARIIDSCE